METLQDLYIYIYVYGNTETLFTFIYLQYIYKIHELILKNNCTHYVYFLINITNTST